MFQGTLQAMLANLENFIDSKTVLGEPVIVGNTTLVPVISIKIGLGSGHSEGLETGGGGGGVTVEPRAVISIQDNNVSVFSLRGGENISGLAELVPEVSQLWEKDANKDVN